MYDYPTQAVLRWLLDKVQGENLVEVRGRMIYADKIISTLIDQIKRREEKLEELQGNSKLIEKLKEEIKELNSKIEDEQRRYSELKRSYEDLKKEKQKVYELDYQIVALKARLEGKEKELEVLRESFIMSKLVIENQRREIEQLRGIIE